MINALIGEIVTIKDGYLVFRSNQVEYILFISNQSASRFSNLDREERKLVRILTTLIVREDALTLYGFYDESEREAFEQLQTVSGIGAKQAIKILSGINVRHLAEALDSGNDPWYRAKNCSEDGPRPSECPRLRRPWIKAE